MELLKDWIVGKWEPDIQILSPALFLTWFTGSREGIKYSFLQVPVQNGKYLTFSVSIQGITDEKHYVRAGWYLGGGH